MTRTRGAARPRTRFVWDELLSHRVPRALRELGFNTTYVGAVDDGAPPRKSSDAAIIEFAQRTNQVIVTSNHDMMLLCSEAGQRFVWIDPRGRQLLQEGQVVLCFAQIREWEQILDSGMCVRALRTKAIPITGPDAARLAMQRFRELRRRRRSAGTKLRPAESGLAAIADWGPDESWGDWTDPTAAP